MVRPGVPLAVVGVATVVFVLLALLVGFFDYFVLGYHPAVNRWMSAENKLSSVLVDCVLTGLMLGVPLAVFYAIGCGVITGASCSFGFAMRGLRYAVNGSVLFCVLSGALVAFLYYLAPEPVSRRTRVSIDPGVTDAWLEYKAAWHWGAWWGTGAASCWASSSSAPTG